MFNLFDTIEANGLNTFTLKFANREMEREFVAEQFYGSKNLFQFSLFLALGTFATFATVDYFYAQADMLLETAIGVAAVFFLAFLALYFVNSDSKMQYARPIISAAIFIIGFSSLYFICVDHGQYHIRNYLGLYLVFAYAFSFLKLGFFYAFIPCFSVYALYIMASIFVLDYSTDDHAIYNTFISFGFAIVSIAGYINEAHIRNGFCLKRNLENERKKVDEQNHALETEVERRTLELLRMNKVLTRAKLKAQGSDMLKSAFLANLSHEIRTPLTKLVGFSQLIANDSLPASKKMQYSQNIDEGATQLMRIINDLIELSKIEAKDISIQATEFKLNVLLAEAESIAREELAKAGKQGLVDYSTLSSLPNSLSIIADKFKLRQVLSNFISNAVKFTHCGLISLRCEERSDGMIEFCIEDTGIGIEQENQSLIFDSFRQLDSSPNRAYAGNGIGLAINKGLVKAMGGKLWLKSAKDNGSKFYFTVPLSI
jgi:signal transduction histidine kinase